MRETRTTSAARIVAGSVFVLTMSLAGLANAKLGDPCARVSCSNHGTCVVVQGQPVCACDEGYVADPATRLTCNPQGGGVRDTSRETIPGPSSRGMLISGIVLDSLGAPTITAAVSVLAIGPFAEALWFSLLGLGIAEVLVGTSLIIVGAIRSRRARARNAARFRAAPVLAMSNDGMVFGLTGSFM